MAFVKATKKQARARVALQGPAGSGKTFSALSIATHLVEPGQRVCLVDTEHKSAAKYADLFDFDVEELTTDYHPDKVGRFIGEAAKAGAGAIIFDSTTAFWNNTGGFLELVDAEVKKQKARGGRADSFAAWKDVDPIYRRMVHAILSAPIHVICCLRAKTAYERTEDEKGKTKIQKLGLAPEIRDSFQYEMDIEGMLDMEHNLVIGKTRCHALDGRVFTKPGADIATILKSWLDAGEPEPLKPAAPDPAPELTPETVRALASELGMDVAKLCEHYNVETVEDMTAADIAHVVTVLKQRKAKMLAKAAKATA